MTAALETVFGRALPKAEYVTRSVAALAPIGLSPENTLALVGVCRDELTFELAELLHDTWGPAFALGSLGGMLFLGRTGISAAGHHAPGEDGRARYVAYAFPHVGVDEDGTIGPCRRRGQLQDSIACGALAAIQAELVEGVLDVDLDPADLEQSLLRQRMLRSIRYGHVPTLAELTTIAHDVICADVVELTRELAREPATDVAVFTGILIHGPGGEDWVAPGQSFALLGSGHREHPLEL